MIDFDSTYHVETNEVSSGLVAMSVQKYPFSLGSTKIGVILPCETQPSNCVRKVNWSTEDWLMKYDPPSTKSIPNDWLLGVSDWSTDRWVAIPYQSAAAQPAHVDIIRATAGTVNRTIFLTSMIRNMPGILRVEETIMPILLIDTTTWGRAWCIYFYTSFRSVTNEASCADHLRSSGAHNSVYCMPRQNKTNPLINWHGYTVLWGEMHAVFILHWENRSHYTRHDLSWYGQLWAWRRSMSIALQCIKTLMLQKQCVSKASYGTCRSLPVKAAVMSKRMRTWTGKRICDSPDEVICAWTAWPQGVT